MKQNQFRFFLYLVSCEMNYQWKFYQQMVFSITNLKMFYLTFLSLLTLINSQFVQSVVILANTSKSLNRICSCMAIGSGWVVWAYQTPNLPNITTIQAYNNETGQSNIQNISFYIDQMSISIQDIYTDISQVHLYVRIKDQTQFMVYKMYDLTIIDFTFNQFIPKDFIFLSNTQALFMSIQLIYFYNMTTSQYIVVWDQIGRDYYFINMFSYAGMVYLNVYPKDSPGNGRCLSFFLSDPLNSRMIFNNSYEETTKCHTIFYDRTTDSLVYVCPHFLNVYNASSTDAYYLMLTIDPFSANNFSFAVMCSNILIIGTQTSIQFYSTQSWSMISVYQLSLILSPSPIFLTNQVQCIADYTIEFQGIDDRGYRRLYRIVFDIRYSNTTILNNTSNTNTTNNTNNTNTTNTTNTINTTNTTNITNLTNNYTSINSTLNDTNTTNNNSSINATNITNIQTNSSGNNSSLISNSTLNTANSSTSTNSTINATDLTNSSTNSTINTTGTTNGSTNSSTNSSGITNSTFNNLNNSYIINSTNNSIQNFQSNTTQLFHISNNFFVNKSIQLLQDPITHKVLSQLFNSISIKSSISSLRQILKPISFLIEQFWYYGTHKIRYTNFFDQYTKKTDILNEIRIKPTFLDNLSFQIQINQAKNQLYDKQNILHDRFPNDIFFLLSIQDIYTVNLFQTIIMTILTFILKLIIGYLRHRLSILNILYKQLKINLTLPFIYLIGMQSNLGNIVFYACAQLNVFFSFDCFTKMNLVITALVLFVFFAYTCLFYWLMYRFWKRILSKKLLNVCFYSFGGFLVQAALNCHRRFCVAFVHSVMTNSHFIQILSLIIVDLYILTILCKLRSKIRNKFVFILIFTYFFLFLALDCGIFIGTQIIYAQNINIYRQSIFFNYYELLIVLIFCIIVLIQIVTQIFNILLHTCMQIRRYNRNKIKSNEKKQKQKSDQIQKKKEKQNIEIKQGIKSEIKPQIKKELYRFQIKKKKKQSKIHQSSKIKDKVKKQCKVKDLLNVKFIS